MPLFTSTCKVDKVDKVDKVTKVTPLKSGCGGPLVLFRGSLVLFGYFMVFYGISWYFMVFHGTKIKVFNLRILAQVRKGR